MLENKNQHTSFDECLAIITTSYKPCNATLGTRADPPTHSFTHLVSLLVGSDDNIMFSEAERDPVEEEGEDMKYTRGGGRAENSGQL